MKIEIKLMAIIMIIATINIIVLFSLLYNWVGRVAILSNMLTLFLAGYLTYKERDK